jgi:hypothetical protein
MSNKRQEEDFSSVMARLTIRAIIAFFMLLGIVLMWAWQRRKRKNPDEISPEGTIIGIVRAVVAFVIAAIAAYIIFCCFRGYYLGR